MAYSEKLLDHYDNPLEMLASLAKKKTMSARAWSVHRPVVT